MKGLPVLKTARTEVRLARQSDVVEIVDYYSRNQAAFDATNPIRPPEFFTELFWQEQVSQSVEEFLEDESARFFIFGEATEARPAPILGQLSLNHIVRGVFHACYLGYSLDETHQRKGLMTEAIQAVLDYAFGELNLHRIMANYMPENERSAAVLKRLGFVKEGVARDYLMIQGKWRDHVLTSLINPKWRSST